MKKREAQFDRLYTRLNDKQREAVDAIEGPVLVMAGPGTGKTQILSLRIANILRLTDTSPDAILALTFTNAGVYAMRERLVSIIGPAAHRVRIHTFHSFCNETIERYPEYFPRIIGGANASEAVRYTLVESLLDSGAYERIRPAGDPYYYVPGAIAAISELKREYFDPDAFDRLLAKREQTLLADPNVYHEKGRYKGTMKGSHRDALQKLEKLKELAALYRAYESALAERRLYDFDDMIGEAARALEGNENLRLILQEEHQYILADEHQDANDSQNRILDILAGFYESPNLFVVGDAKQAIYRFQGASKENFLQFSRRYPDARIIALEENYRSHQTILDAAHGLISEEPLVARAGGDAAALSVARLPDADRECAFVARHIARRIAAGAKPSEIAVMYRKNEDAEDISRALEHEGVRTVVESSRDTFSDPAIRMFRTVLRAAALFGDDAILAEALYAPFLPIAPSAAHELIMRSRDRREPLAAVLREREPKLFELFSRWRAMAYAETAQDAFAAVFAESGFRGWALSRPRSRELIEGIESLFGLFRDASAALPRMTLSEALRYLDTSEAYGLSVGARDADISDRVRLMTVHRSKGREFDYVYIVRATEKKWSGKSAPSKGFTLPLRPEDISYDTADDERHLFYVALTRGRKDVCITFAEKTADGTPTLPTPFIECIRPWCVELLDDAKEPPNILVPVLTAGPSYSDIEYVRDLFRRRGLSATALNNYLACPWKYFFLNLIRIPDAKAAAASYGTAAHAALKEFFDAFAKGSSADAAALVASFERHLERQTMSARDLAAYREKGRVALRGYVEAYASMWHTENLTEYRIAGFPLSDTLTLSGSLDKIELYPDGVVVVDYKTKQPQSRNAIEGGTKESTGDMKRQLVFYKLLLEGYAGDKFRMKAGEIDFIEPTKAGAYKKEQFIITDEEVSELRETILRVAGEIQNLSFWNTRCEDAECVWCPLGEALRAK